MVKMSSRGTERFELHFGVILYDRRRSRYKFDLFCIGARSFNLQIARFDEVVGKVFTTTTQTRPFTSQAFPFWQPSPGGRISSSA